MNKRKRMINFKTLFSVAIVALLIVVVTVLVIMNNNPVYNENYFKSDNTKLVLRLDNDYPEDDEKSPIRTYMVYYYSGDTINNVKQFYQFKSDEVAKNVIEETKKLEMNWVKEISLSGSYIIFELTEDQYEGVTTTQIRESIESIEVLDNDNSTGTENDEVNVENDDAIAE